MLVEQDRETFGAHLDWNLTWADFKMSRTCRHIPCLPRPRNPGFYGDPPVANGGESFPRYGSTSPYREVISGVFGYRPFGLPPVSWIP